MERKEYSQYLRTEKKYSCSQCVLCTYAKHLNVSEDTAYRLSEGFARGFGAREEVCGAVAAMAMVIGLKNSDGEMSNGSSKASTLEKVNTLTNRFIEKNGSHMCHTLLSQNTNTRTCDTLIQDCIDMLEEEMQS